MFRLVLLNHKNLKIELSLSDEGEYYRFVNSIHKQISGVFRAYLYVGRILLCVRTINAKPGRVYYHKTRKLMPFEHFLKHWPDYSYTTCLLYAQYIDDPEIVYSKFYQ